MEWRHYLLEESLMVMWVGVMRLDIFNVVIFNDSRFPFALFVSPKVRLFMKHRTMVQSYLASYSVLFYSLEISAPLKKLHIICQAAIIGCGESRLLQNSIAMVLTHVFRIFIAFLNHVCALHYYMVMKPTSRFFLLSSFLDMPDCVRLYHLLIWEGIADKRIAYEILALKIIPWERRKASVGRDFIADV